jgi:hypothetical protein
MSTTLTPVPEKTKDPAQETPQEDKKNASQENAQAQDESHDGRREKLPVEAKFDKRVYGGISYFGQAAAGIILTNWIRHGSGRKHYDKLAQWVGPNLISRITSKKGAEAIKEADSWIVVSTMVMCGNAFLLPVKWLENAKSKIVRGMQEKENLRREARGEVIPVEERANQERLLTELDNAPKQSWTSLLTGRAFGLAAVYATLWGTGKKANGMAEDAITHGIQKGAETIGMKQLSKSKTLENYLRIGFYDTAYSAVSAGGLYVYSHFLHPHKKGEPARAEPEGVATSVVLPVIASAQLAENAPAASMADRVRKDKPEKNEIPRPHMRVEPKPAAQRFQPAANYTEMAKAGAETERIPGQ